jgi:hypothetical protein
MICPWRARSPVTRRTAGHLPAPSMHRHTDLAPRSRSPASCHVNTFQQCYVPREIGRYLFGVAKSYVQASCRSMVHVLQDRQVVCPVRPVRAPKKFVLDISVIGARDGAVTGCRALAYRYLSISKFCASYRWLAYPHIGTPVCRYVDRLPAVLTEYRSQPTPPPGEAGILAYWRIDVSSVCRCVSTSIRPPLSEAGQCWLHD